MKNQLPILGMYSKSSGGVQISFARSGCDNCDAGCPHHPRSTHEDPTRSCYAVAAEVRRTNIAAKLARHERLGCAETARRATDELGRMRKAPSIVRLSAFGSVPPKPTAHDIDALMTLLKLAKSKGLPVHFPVESEAKTEVYRASLGHLAAVRQSLYNESDLDSAPGPISFTAGNRGAKRVDNKRDAVAAAKRRRDATNRRCIVCPAVFATSPKCKCGPCTACCDRNVDVVFPLH